MGKTLVFCLGHHAATYDEEGVGTYFNDALLSSHEPCILKKVEEEEKEEEETERAFFEGGEYVGRTVRFWKGYILPL